MRVVASRTFLLSLAGMTGGALLCIVAIARALTVEPVAAASTELMGIASGAELPIDDLASATVPSESVLEMESLALAVDHDPFMPDRRRAQPYRLPGEYMPQPVAMRMEEPEPPPFRVIGTAMVGESGIALVETLEAGAPEIMRVGGSLLGYRLQSVDAETATLVRQSQTLTLAVQSGTDGRGVGGRNPETEADLVRDVMLRELRERGVAPELIEQMLNAQNRVGGQQWFQFQGGREGFAPLSTMQFFGNTDGRGPTVRLRADTIRIPNRRPPESQ
jgi:hypothetical protein